ncbi:MAG: 2-C-methyl-D-erythritol 2,4-cyclodiphosphate synthase [Chloroflexota bacterium]|nr:2-C-methyl-D-erythritol 2,4-cyclodiphosphate synthase [Chloroflexota bacterium]
MRVGIGYDVHPFVKGRKLILGGVTIPFGKGLGGHSDADVLIHAVMDALLGAAGLEDIGTYFPNTDPQYKDISSIVLLEQTHELIISQGWKIGNIDVTVLAEAPKLAPVIPEMRQYIADTLDMSLGQISIKATTCEGLGFVGRKEGIAAHAVALLLSLHE